MTELMPSLCNDCVARNQCGTDDVKMCISYTKETTELKPCPFCGGEAKMFHYEQGDYYNEAFSVYCDNCGASLEDYDFEEQAIEHWNTRVVAE